jgi:hypothetical protein
MSKCPKCGIEITIPAESSRTGCKYICGNCIIVFQVPWDRKVKPFIDKTATAALRNMAEKISPPTSKGRTLRTSSSIADSHGATFYVVAGAALLGMFVTALAIYNFVLGEQAPFWAYFTPFLAGYYFYKAYSIKERTESS